MATGTAIASHDVDLMSIFYGAFNHEVFKKSRLIDFDKLQAERRRARGEKIVRADHGENVAKVFAVLSSESQFWSVYALAKCSNLSEKAVHGVLRKLLSRDLLKKKTVKTSDGKTYRYYRLKETGEA